MAGLFDREQGSILWQSAAALLVAGAVLAAGYRWLPPEALGASGPMPVAGRLAFALKWDLPVLLWLAGCVGSVSEERFWNPADRKGSAYSKPSPAIVVRLAVLQNSLEQTVLAIGAHLVLAALLRGAELVLIPLLVLLYLLGRASFAAGYAAGALGRAFGMALTGAALLFALILAAALVVAGR